MCGIGIALALGSTLLGAAGQVQQGKAASNAANYNAQIGEMNAMLADRRAKDAMERGAREEQIQRQKGAQLLGRQRAALGANGVDLGFGSILDLQIDSAAEAEMDALTIRQNSAREAYDFQVQGVNSRAEAGLMRANAKAAKTGSYPAAAGTILGGGADAYKEYKRSALTVGRS